MGTQLNMSKSLFIFLYIIFGTSDGYLNTAPSMDQHKTFKNEHNL